MKENNKYIGIFDYNYVHYVWDCELDGKDGFVNDGINGLKEDVISGCLDRRDVINYSNDDDNPFESGEMTWKFAYFDPSYDIKRAYIRGEKIQYRFPDKADWCDIDTHIDPDDKDFNYIEFIDNLEKWNCCLRVKPEEPKLDEANDPEQYRPFKDCAELIEHFKSKLNISFDDCMPPPIYLRNKLTGIISLITGFGEHGSPTDTSQYVWFDSTKIPLSLLLKGWEFFDGKPCGIPKGEKN